MEDGGFELISKEREDDVIFQSAEIVEPPSFDDHRSHHTWKFILFVGCLLLFSSRMLMSICSVEMAKDFGWDKRLSGLVMSSFFFGYVLTQILGGVLSDQYGGEVVMCAAALVWALATLFIPMVNLLFFLPETAGIIILRILTGGAQGFHFPAMASFISKKIPSEHRNSVFSFAASGTAMGSIFSGFAGSMMLEHSGWRSAFICVGVMCLLWAMVVVIFVNRDGFHPSQCKHIKAVPVDSLNWNKLMTSFPCWALLICSACESMVFANLLSWLPTYFHDVFPDSKGWLFNVLPWVGSLIVQITCGQFTDKLITSGSHVTKVRKTIVGIALFPPVVFCMLLSQASSFPSALCLMTLIIGGLGANSSGIGMNAQDIAPNHAGSVFGVVNTLGALSGMFAVYITGHILDASGQWTAVFQMTSFVSLVGGLVFVRWGSGDRVV